VDASLTQSKSAWNGVSNEPTVKPLSCMRHWAHESYCSDPGTAGFDAAAPQNAARNRWRSAAGLGVSGSAALLVG